MRGKKVECEYKGSKIEVFLKDSYFPPKSIEQLSVDGKVIAKNELSPFRLFSRIVSKHSFDGIDEKIEVRIAQGVRSVRIATQIKIGDKVIGGSESLQYPDIDKLNLRIGKGYVQYFLTFGLFRFGLPFGIFFSLLHIGDIAPWSIGRFIFATVTFGLVMSAFFWSWLKKSIHQLPKL